MIANDCVRARELGNTGSVPERGRKESLLDIKKKNRDGKKTKSHEPFLERLLARILKLSIVA